VNEELSSVVAENVRRLRTENGWSRKRLAERLGWSESKVVDLEHGREDRERPASVDDIGRLCLAFQCSVFDLLLPLPDSVEREVERREIVERIFRMPPEALAPDQITRSFDAYKDRVILRGHPDVIAAGAPLADLVENRLEEWRAARTDPNGADDVLEKYREAVGDAALAFRAVETATISALIAKAGRDTRELFAFLPTEEEIAEWVAEGEAIVAATLPSAGPFDTFDAIMELGRKVFPDTPEVVTVAEMLILRSRRTK